MEWTLPFWIALITLIQSIATEALRKKGQAKNLTCSSCGSKQWKINSDPPSRPDDNRS